jgi:hypothetical protein
VAFEDYNFDLEHKIISKTSEWIQWRAKEKAERQERINRRELARLKYIEDEQKQKLNQVSYPSSDDEEDDELATEASNPTSIPRKKALSPTNFNTILMPTQASVLEKKSHRRYASNSSNKIDFSFFESDASPFDHLEMKSMNEMEVLAQVLGSTPVEGSSLERDNSSESESSDHKDNNNVAPPDPQVAISCQQFQQSYVPYNNYYATPTPVFYNFPALANQYGHPNHQNQFLYPQNYAVNYQYVAPNNNNIIENGTDEPESQSKSVPSILKELNDELNNSQRRRIRNNSQNSPKEVTEGELLIFFVFFFLISRSAAQTSPVEDDFSKLSLKTQTLTREMGFQREMVLRAVERLGDNDKKIVEHLIPLSELIPLGFDEAQISEALIKFDNNKDRALDYLIS